MVWTVFEVTRQPWILITRLIYLPRSAGLKYNDQDAFLFVNEKALFFLVLGVPKSKLSNLKEIFTDNLRQTLIQENIDKQIIEKILIQYDIIESGKTDNGNIVSSMRYIAFMYEELILLKGGIEGSDIQTIMRNRNHNYS